MSLKCGIVGLPNVGKSTLFNALTKAGIAAENYPFCTIEPNVGIVEVPDRACRRWPRSSSPSASCRRSSSSSTSPAWWPARRKGEGLGNQFLANIRETDAIVQRGALLRRRQRDPRRRQGRSDLRHRGDPDRAVRWPTWRPSRRRCTRYIEGRQVGRRQGSQQARRRAGEGASAALDEAKPVRALDLQQGRAGAAQAALPDHREAGDVRRQRRGERLREQPAPRPAARSTPAAEGAPVVADLRQRSKPRSPTWTTRTRQMFLADMGQDRAGPESR